LALLTDTLAPAAKILMDHFWPGQVTLLFRAKETLPAELTAGSGKIGVRLAGHPVAVSLLRSVGQPLTGTSANPSGHSGCADISQMVADIVDQVDLVLDAGPLEGGPGSTVVDTTVHPVAVVREGAVAAKRIQSALLETVPQKH
jgi:L-threonylcarbamoyladenylate synthase